ncbi:MAG TPA: HAD family phosphatase [Rhodospirillales bacterium]|nr:HAD family phosphatase [Rhodospirillales bacterium]HJO69187.1 HAD family phosphatase [Rhodospirillales bacterium]
MSERKPPTNSIALVIFDVDGVLVDSEVISNRVMVRELGAMGHVFDESETARAFTGLSVPDIKARIEAQIGRPLPDDFAERLWRADRDAFAAELKPVAGVAEALRRIPIAKCVASSGSLEKIRNSLSLTGLLEAFDGCLFSAHGVPRGKPAPDLFLFAARHLGVEAAACVVVEDSVPGVLGAKAAAMHVLGFAGASHAGPGYAEDLRAAGADQVFADMEELPALLGCATASG